MKDSDDTSRAEHGNGIMRVTAWALFITICLIVTYILLSHCWSYLLFDLPLDDGEGFVLNQARMIAEVENPYQPIDTPPFMVTNYPPVFIGILALLVKLFGIKLALGRVLSVIAGLGIMYLCFLATVPREGKSSFLPSIIAPALFAATPVVYFWMPLCRIDMFANFLSLAAIVIAWRFPTRRGLYWSLPILWLALYTRQSAVEGFVVIAVMLYMQRRQELLRFVILYFAGALLIFIAFYTAYGPEFLKHLTTYTKTRYSLARTIASYEIIFGGIHLPTGVGFFRTAGMLLPTVVAIFASWRLWNDKNARWWVVYFIVGFLLTFLVGKVGSAQNYFLPMFIPQAIITGLWVTHEYNNRNVSAGVKNALVVGMALLVAYMGFVIGDRIGSFPPNDASKTNGELLIKIIEGFDGPVFMEDEGLTLLAGRDVIYTPFIMNELNKEGLWDQGPFLETLQRAEYELIILRFNVFDFRTRDERDHSGRHWDSQLRAYAVGSLDLEGVELVEEHLASCKVCRPGYDDVPGKGDMAGWDRFSPEMEEAIRRNYIISAQPVDVRRSWYIYTRRWGGPSINLVFE